MVLSLRNVTSPAVGSTRVADLRGRRFDADQGEAVRNRHSVRPRAPPPQGSLVTFLKGLSCPLPAVGLDRSCTPASSSARDPGQRDDALVKARPHRTAPFASLITCIEAPRTALSGWWPGGSLLAIYLHRQPVR